MYDFLLIKIYRSDVTLGSEETSGYQMVVGRITDGVSWTIFVLHKIIIIIVLSIMNISTNKHGL